MQTTTTKQKTRVESIAALDLARVRMNVNVYRQNRLSRPTVAMLSAASIIGRGELETMRNATTDGRICDCTISHGALETPEASDSERADYARRTVRITSPSRKKIKPWLDLIYADPEDAQAVIDTIS